MATVEFHVLGTFGQDGLGTAVVAPAKGKVTVTMPWTEGTDDPAKYSQPSVREFRAKKVGEILGYIKVPVKLVGPGTYVCSMTYNDPQAGAIDEPADNTDDSVS